MRTFLLAILAVSLAACGGGGGAAAALSSDASLLSLTVSTGTLSPGFSPGVTTYTVGPAVLAANAQVTPTAEAAGATVTVDGVPVAVGAVYALPPLAMGATTVTVVVTAPDFVTTRMYTVVFDRTSAELSDLTASAGALTPVFDATVSSYGVGPTLLPGSTTITPTAADPAATVTVNTVATPSGSASGDIPLPLGLTPVTVAVTARDGTSTTYAVVFNSTLPAQQAYLKASNTGAGDQFGFTVALSGDTLVVGAPFEASSATGVNGNQTDNSAAESGAAYVFVRSGTTWSQQAYLKASNAGASDKFGSSVALSADTLVVGAFQEDSSATVVNGNEADNSALDSGAAYVFVRSGTTWSQQAYLKASNSKIYQGFGYSVALSGETLVVSGLGDSSSATGVNGSQVDTSAPISGAAYVFVRNGTTWSQQAYLKASNTGAGDEFGTSVAISGDTLVVSAESEDSSATGVNGNQANNSAGRSGAAYVFVRSGTTWSQQAYLKASNTEATDIFGISVALSGDTLVVGAEFEDGSATGVNGDQADNSASGSGAAYVFVRSGTTWSQQAYLKASNTEATDLFGISVALSGDTLVVGAVVEDSSATGVNGNQADNSTSASGAAYVFVRSGTTWSQQAYLKASLPGTGDGFGSSVAISGGTLVAVAGFEDSIATGVNGNQADNSALDSGAIYVFR